MRDDSPNSTFTRHSLDIVPVSEAKQRALSKGVPEDQADQIASAYGDAQLVALKESLGAVAVVALLSLWFTRRLPTSAEEPAPAKEAEAVPATA